MRLCIAALMIAVPTFAFAGPSDFTTGPVIKGYGPAAMVEGAMPISDTMSLKVAFDTAKGSEDGGLNRTLESAARFLNMHGKAGVDPDQIDLAVIIHGPAVMDVLNADAFAERYDGSTNPNAELISQLKENKVRIIVCGQTAAYRDVSTDDLLPGVEVDLSAMTAHARLQQQGYTLNPF